MPTAPDSDDFTPPPAPVSAPASRRAAARFYQLAEVQVRHPWMLLALAAALVAVSLVLASRLRVRPGFDALLPENRPSVVELDRVKQHVRGLSSIFVILEGDDTTGLRRAADAVVGRVAAVGPPWVGSVESGLHQARGFLRPRAGLYAPLADVEKLRDEVDERYSYELHEQSGALLDEDDGEAPPTIDLASIKQRFGIEDTDAERYPDGYFQSRDGKTVVVSIHSGVLGTDWDQGTEAIKRVRHAVSEAAVTRFDPSIRFGLVGDLVTSIGEYRAINDDLTKVGLIGACLIVGVVFLYYLRLRTVLTMVLTIGIGVSLSFGCTELLVGQLNMATGFLFTIIAGNGINPGIIYMARFLEARRRGVDVRNAVRVAHRETWLPTLTASTAAAAAYASLTVTEFRGFRDFGIIGGAGMVLCWLATYAFLPVILVLTERVAPTSEGKAGLFGLLPKASESGTHFGAPFAELVARAPRLVTVVGAVLTVAAVAATARWIAADPMEYDLTHLRSDSAHRTEEIRLTHLAENITGFVGYDGMAILADRPEQVTPLVAALKQRRDSAPASAKPFGAVHTLQEFVPGNQAKKIPLLLEIKDKVLRSHKLGGLTDQQLADISPYLPPDDLKPFGIVDLPDDMARAFTERDGTRGRIVYISPLDVKLVDDAHYLFRWANAYRRTELPNGDVVLGSGRAVIYADMWQAIVEDVPKAVFASLTITLLAVALAFRRGFASTVVLAALLTGVAWMTGMLGVGGVKLNFLNFIALPITFGIGADYAVNVMQRYRREGPGRALAAVRSTGGAVVLCSLTTTLGYLALVGSINHAARSLGVAAVLGEVACLLAAVIVLPGALSWRDARRGYRQRGKPRVRRG